MANWINKINIAKSWKTENPIEIAKDIIKQLPSITKLPQQLLTERDEIIDEFESFILESDETAVDHFDSIMCQLYDWGDTSLDQRWNGKKVCWFEIVTLPSD